MIDRFLADERHEGWGLVRLLWAGAMLMTWLQRSVHFEERYTDVGATVLRSYIPVTDYYYFSPLGGWITYGLLLGSVLFVAKGKWVKPMIGVALVAHLMLIFTEGMNFKGYDRLLFWQGICLLVAPGSIDGKATGMPVGRYCVLITYFGLYGQTGWEKIANEPTWWEGLPLMYDLVHRNFGNMPLGVWISDVKWLIVPMCWITLIFEASFPVLWFFKRIRPWLLLTGLGFHIGILLLLNVPNFSAASIAMYPMLVLPSEYVRYRDNVLAWWARVRPSALPVAS